MHDGSNGAEDEQARPAPPEEESRPQPKRRGRPPRAASASVPPSAPVAIQTMDGKDGQRKTTVRRQQKNTPAHVATIDVSAIDDRTSPGAPRVISLPISDTPIMERNKEFRRRGGPGGNVGGGRASGRRSSFGSRGRRASSLIESGHSALPHRELNSGEFYKHINAEELEPRRMRQLLTWCGDRALCEKPPHGVHGSSAVLGGKFLSREVSRR